VSKNATNYNFSINKETVKNLANTTMDAINSNITPEIGKNISIVIGATAGVRGGL
jgi:hypothetical protein